MDNEPVYYQPPATHDAHLRSMVIGLSVFFSALFISAALLIIYARELAVHLPFKAEKQFVKPYEVMAGKWFDGDAGNHDVATYLQELGADLASNMAMPDDFQISIHYIDSDIQNAFATLGGHVFIFRGVLESVEHENGLAMVLAHELAHIKNRDPVVALGRGAALQLVYAFVTGDYGRSGEALATMGGDLGILFFSREQEELADIDAVYALNSYYGHVAGYKTFFEKLKDEHGEAMEDIPEWLSTHPDTAGRIDSLAKLIDEQGFQIQGQKPLPTLVTNHLEDKKQEKAKNKVDGSLSNELEK